MQTTRHSEQRMSQRGISKEMMNMTVTHGVSEGDKYVFGCKEAKESLREIDYVRSVLMKVIDKGGTVAVVANGVVITTYNRNSKKHRR